MGGVGEYQGLGFDPQPIVTRFFQQDTEKAERELVAKEVADLWRVAGKEAGDIAWTSREGVWGGGYCGWMKSVRTTVGIHLRDSNHSKGFLKG